MGLEDASNSNDPVTQNADNASFSDEVEGNNVFSMEYATEKPERRHWTSRKIAIPIEEFMERVIEPIMSQVAAGNLKKNLGMVVAAMCARSTNFPYENYRSKCKTNPLQTLSADLTRYHKHPAYEGKKANVASKIMPSQISLDQVVVPVYPTWNADYNIPSAVIQRLVALCNQYGIDHTLFTTTGGEITLSNNFLKVAAYFASDKGLDRESHIWGDMKPISHVPAEFLEEQDKPSYLRKPSVPGKRGRPRKSVDISDKKDGVLTTI